MEVKPDEEIILPRLEFSHDTYDPSKNYLDTYCTYAMQGKIFYKWKDKTYTQSRDDIPKRMFIRGKELEKETYLPLFEIFDSVTSKYEDVVIVLMVTRQDLLITHPVAIGIQVFFLGCIVDDSKFIPAAVAVETNIYIKELVENNNIQTTENYFTPNKVYIPARITEQEKLESVLETRGSFISTTDGFPVTISTERENQVFEYFSDTQNNIQLFVRLFFITSIDGEKDPKEIKDIEKKLEIVSKFSPIDKTVEFIPLIESFRSFLLFFDDKKVCHGIAQNNKEIYLEHNSIDDKEMKMMEKPLKSLATFIKNIQWNLKNNRKNGINKEILLHIQIKDAIFSFFKFDKNINNCCHLLKSVERLAIR